MILIKEEIDSIGSGEIAHEDSPLFHAPHYPSEVAGVSALRRFAHDSFGDDDPGRVLFTGRTRTVRQEADGTFLLELPLPFVDADDLDVRKRGDEMYIRLGSFKRELLLPRALADSEPSGATVRDNTLTIRFRSTSTTPVHPGEGVTGHPADAFDDRHAISVPRAGRPATDRAS